MRSHAAILRKIAESGLDPRERYVAGKGGTLRSIDEASPAVTIATSVTETVEPVVQTIVEPPATKMEEVVAQDLQVEVTPEAAPDAEKLQEAASSIDTPVEETVKVEPKRRGFQSKKKFTDE